MFTGIVETLGRIASLQAPRKSKIGGTSTVRMVVATKLNLGDFPLGGSIAVNGVCLTVVEKSRGRFAADLGPETLGCTTLGSLAVGDDVHLERPLRVGDPLGGHLVSGHVDGVGKILGTERKGRSLGLVVQAPATLRPLLVAKGSIALDGVSLTVNRVDARGFGVMLIPHTLSVTALGQYQPGRRVNLEADLIAKHVERLIQRTKKARAR